MADAELALFYGDWDTALSSFQAAVSQTAESTVRARGQLGLARTLYGSGRVWEAIDAFTGFIDSYPQDELLADAYLLRAEARFDVGLYEPALEDYERFLTLRPGRIDAYVKEWEGDALRGAGRPLEAVQRYREAAQAPRLTDTVGLEIKIGQAYSEAGEYDLALAQFDLVYQLSGSTFTKAAMNLLSGQVLETMEDYQGAYARYLDSVNNFPDAYDAYLGLIRLVDAGVPVDEFQRGLIDYNAAAYEPALNAFERHLSVSPTAAGYYYRGLTRRALGYSAGALADFNHVVDEYPEDPIRPSAWLEKARTEWAYLDMLSVAVQSYLDFVATYPASADAPEALFYAGRTAEREGELARAAEIWLRLIAEYPSSDRAFQGAFLAGIARFRLGDYAGANQVFLDIQRVARGPGDLAATNLWIGKCLEASQNPTGAQQAWMIAAEADPTGYYSVRAEELLNGGLPFQTTTGYDFRSDVVAEREQAEVWLRSTFVITGPDPLWQLDGALANDPQMVRGEELLRLGKVGEAEAELDALTAAVQSDAEATYRLMHKLLDMRLYRLAILASRQILRLAAMDDAATMSAPVYFNRIRFGPYFADLILPEAAARGLDGVLALAVVRQESLFDGTSTSSAQARGLMQVIPSTGQGIANALGWPPDYSEDDLYRPLVSIRFGTYYLASQRDRFDGDLYAALAAYNGGPGNAQAWKELAPDDPDLFLEIIRLSETHLYVRRIAEIFAIYRDLYGTS